MSLTIAQILDDAGGAFLDGVRAVLRHDGPGGPVLYVLSGNGLTVLTIGPDGSVAVLEERAVPEGYQPGVPASLTVVETALGPVLLTSGLPLSGSGALRLDGAGGFADPASPGGYSGPLIGASGAQIDGRSLVITGLSGGGLAVLDYGADGVLVTLSTLADDGVLGLGGVVTTGVAAVAEQTVLLAASAGEGVLTSLAVGADGSLSPIDWIGISDGLALGGTARMETLTLAGQSFVVLATSGASALSVFRIEPDGSLTLTDHVTDSLDTRFQMATALAQVDVGGRHFLAVGGADDGVSLLELLPGGRLVLLDTFADTVPATLTNVTGLALYAVGDTLNLLAGGEAEAGVTRLTRDLAALGGPLLGGAGSDTLAGSPLDDLMIGDGGDDLLSGSGGADILWDGAGRDTISGGTGADLFVLSADGQDDRITDYAPGLDRLDLSGWTGLHTPDQITVTPTATGAVLSYGDEVLVIDSAAGGPLSPADFPRLDILPLDRPLFVPTTQAQSGGAGNDSLSGGLGNDSLSGAGGDDWIDGRDGADVLSGGTGEDAIIGGAGDDWLSGNAGFDTITGGDGADTIDGGANADQIHGGPGDDQIAGGGGADRLRGEDGRDWIEGADQDDRIWAGPGDDGAHGAGWHDTLWGGAGDDTLWGGLWNDLVLGEHGDDLIFGDAGFDTVNGGAGDDVVNGGGQADLILGGPGRDRLIGEDGQDRLEGGSGGDRLNGGDGADTLLGEDGNDVLLGGSGHDRLLGGAQDDRLLGEGGDDWVDGGAGFDTLTGGTGDDTLTGGFNADLFIFADGFGSDRITDFDAANTFELLDFSAVSAVASWAEVLARTSEEAGDLIIDFGGGDVLRLSGVSLPDFDAGDVLL